VAISQHFFSLIRNCDNLICRKRAAAKKAGAAAGAKGAAKAKVGPGGKKPMVRADDAKITLEKAAKMTIEEIQDGLEQAEREGDKASQINILFLLASSLLQQEQLEKQHIEAAVQVLLLHSYPFPLLDL
jgi:hypothetical protein